MNVSLLQEIIEVLRKPETEGQFDMNYWHADRSLSFGSGYLNLSALCDLPKEKQVACGTTHCIAGWAQVLSPDRDCTKDAEYDARRLLDLTSEQAQRLFYGTRWPSGFGGYHATRGQAAKRIEHFIRTEGAE